MNQKINLKLGLKKSLFKRLGFLVVVFTIALISVLYYQFEYFFTDQDQIFASHDMYFYSKMVDDWDTPPDTNSVIKEISNLRIWCGIYERDTTEYGIAYPSKKYWSNLPSDVPVDEFYTWSKSDDFERQYNIDIPHKVFFGTILDRPATVVDTGEFLYYTVIDFIPPPEIYNVIFAIILSILFIVGLYFFISRYLYPVQLMKNRIIELEKGDLLSKIKIIGEDELADLSIWINKLIEDINTLLENKHQLLLEVSHELRSPLTRIQLLIEMMPDHKNIVKLKEEIDFLEGMISNLLLSDRLALPYSRLDLKKFTTDDIVNAVIEMFPGKKERIKIINNASNFSVFIDETKFILALRNLIDNAIKYSRNEQDISFTIINNNKYIEFQIKDSGIGISQKDVLKITDPFYQADQSVTTKGFGLGLTICKKIIESHKGYMTIKSNLKQGSLFILHLPLNK